MSCTEVNWRKNLLFVWLGQILVSCGFAVVIPFIPIYMRDHLGIESEHMRGVWVSAFNFFGQLSFCLAAPLWGALADKYGRKLMLLRANYASAILYPCMLLAPNIAILVFIRFCIAIFAGTYAAAQTLLATTTPKEHHGFVLGTLSTALWSGHMLGYLVGGLAVNYFGFRWTFIGSGGMFLSAALLTQFCVKENFVYVEATSKQSKKRFSSLQGFSIAIWSTLALFVIMGIARKFGDPYVAMMIEKIHGPEKTAYFTGWISGFAAIGGILSGIIIGKFCDKFQPRLIAMPSLFIASIGAFLQFLAPTLSMFAGARFLTYLASGGIDPAFQTILSRSSPENRRGVLFGLATSLRMGGILLSSVLGGAVIYWFGTRSVFIAESICFLMMIPVLILAIWLTNREKKQSQTERTYSHE